MDRLKGEATERRGIRAISILNCNAIADISITGLSDVAVHFSSIFWEGAVKMKKCHKVNGE